MDSARSARLALHFDDSGNGPEHVRAAGSRPLVRVLAHRRCGGNRIDRDYLVGPMRDHGGRFVAVDGNPVSHQIHTSSTAALRPSGDHYARSVPAGMDKDMQPRIAERPVCFGRKVSVDIGGPMFPGRRSTSAQIASRDRTEACGFAHCSDSRPS